MSDVIKKYELNKKRPPSDLNFLNVVTRLVVVREVTDLNLRIFKYEKIILFLNN